MPTFENVRFIGDMVGMGRVTVVPRKLVIRKGGFPGWILLPVFFVLTVGWLAVVIAPLGPLPTYVERWGVGLGSVPVFVAWFYLWPRRGRTLRRLKHRYTVLSPEASLTQCPEPKSGQDAPGHVERNAPLSRNRIVLLLRWIPGTESFRVDSDSHGYIAITFANEQDAQDCWTIYTQKVGSVGEVMAEDSTGNQSTV